MSGIFILICCILYGLMCAASINKSPLFSFEHYPSLLAQLTEEAKNGLTAESKDFRGLNRLNRFFQIPECDFAYYYPEAMKVLNRETFQDLPASFDRLFPLATNYKEKLELVRSSIGESAAILKPLLLDLLEAHLRFQEIFTVECQAAGPYEPFTIASKYPDALRIYFIAIFRMLPQLSEKLYNQWKSDMVNQAPEMMLIVPRLAILYLLENPNEISEFVEKKDEISSLREGYQALNLEDKQALKNALQGECAPTAKVAAIYNRIGDVCAPQNQVMNGVSRIFFEESVKCFSLLEQMEVYEPPRSLELQCRVVFLALLKQPNCENLPYDFKGGKIEDATRVLYQKYHHLSEGDRIKFDHLFLNGADDANNVPVYRILRDWKEVYFYWMGRKQFPLHLLSLIAYQRGMY